MVGWGGVHPVFNTIFWRHQRSRGHLHGCKLNSNWSLLCKTHFLRRFELFLCLVWLLTHCVSCELLKIGCWMCLLAGIIIVTTAAYPATVLLLCHSLTLWHHLFLKETDFFFPFCLTANAADSTEWWRVPIHLRSKAGRLWDPSAANTYRRLEDLWVLPSCRQPDLRTLRDIDTSAKHCWFCSTRPN